MLMKFSTSHLCPVTMTSSYSLISAEYNSQGEYNISFYFYLHTVSNWQKFFLMTADVSCDRSTHNRGVTTLRLPVSSQCPRQISPGLELINEMVLSQKCDPMLAGREKRILTENDGKWRLNHVNFDCRASRLENVESVGSDCWHSK